MLSICTLTVLCLLMMVVGAVADHEDATSPVRYYSATPLQGEGEGCPTDGQREAARAHINQDVRALIQDIYGHPESYSCGGFGTGWTRMAYLNMRN